MNTNKSFARLLAVPLCVALTLSVAPLPAFAANAADDAVIDISGIGGMDDCTGTCWDFDGNNKVFTVKSDVTVVGDFFSGGFGLVFNLEGNSTVTWQAVYNGESSSEDGFTLVDVRGSGTFIVDANSEIVLDYGGSAVKAESGVTVIVHGMVSSVDYDGYPIGGIGIEAAGNVSVSGGAWVYASSILGGVAISAAGDVSVSEGAYIEAAGDGGTAVYAAGNIIVDGGTCKASGDNCKGTYAAGDVFVSGGAGLVEVSGNDSSRAIWAEGNVSVVNGAYVEVSGDNDTAILAFGNVLVSDGGQVHVSGGDWNTAIFSFGNVTVSGGSTVVASGNGSTAIYTMCDASVSGGSSVSASGAGGKGISAGDAVSVSDIASVSGETAVYSVGNVTVDSGYVRGNHLLGMGIRSDYSISIKVTGDSEVSGHSAIVAKLANVTVSGDAYIITKDLLAYVDGELFGNAITAKNVTVEDNARVAALNGAAILYGGKCGITGGAVFALGDGIGGARFEIPADIADSENPVVYNILNVIFKTPNLDIKTGAEYSDCGAAGACVSGDGAALAWDYMKYYNAVVVGGAPISYKTGDGTDIFAVPDSADYHWLVTEGNASISYSKGGTGGEFPVDFTLKPTKPLKYNPIEDDPDTDDSGNSTPDNSAPGNSTPGSSSGSAAPSNPSGSFSGGGGNAYTKGAAAGLVYIVQKDFTQFDSVKVGGSVLTKNKDYKAESGSTKITLLPSYMDALSAGAYTLTVSFKDNTSASAQFTIAAGPKLPFTDVAAGAWYFYAVSHIYARGLMIGTAADKFSPDINLSRAMVVTILHRYAGEPSVSGFSNSFSDVLNNTWYTSAIKWAAARGIVAGYGNGKFGPDDPITKEQLAVLICNTQRSSGKIPPNISAGKTFLDAGKISEWAKTAVNALNNQGIFCDIPGGGFSPQTPARRAETTSMLYRWLTAAI